MKFCKRAILSKPAETLTLLMLMMTMSMMILDKEIGG